jgi:hypothetical protein
MSRCFDEDEILLFISGTATADQLMRIDEHIAECRPCAAWAAAMLPTAPQPTAVRAGRWLARAAGSVTIFAMGGGGRSTVGPLWAQLEREAHRMVLDLFETGKVVDDAELIARRVLLAHADISASMRQEYIDALAETVRRYAALLGEPTTR